MSQTHESAAADEVNVLIDEADELQKAEPASRRRLSLSRFNTQPMPSETITRRSSGWGGMVEVGWTFFKDAAMAKDRIVDLEKEAQANQEKYDELNDKFERMQLRAEAALVKQKMLQQQLDEVNKTVEDSREVNANLSERVTFAEASMKAVQSKMHTQEQELQDSYSLEADLRQELRRALHDEELVGNHLDLMASETELRRTRHVLALKDQKLKAADKQLLELRQEVVTLRCRIEDNDASAEKVHLQCQDCDHLERFYQSQLEHSSTIQKQLEVALADSLAQQEALRWNLIQEKRQHGELKEEHNTKMLEARQEAAFLRKSLDHHKKESRWRHPKPAKVEIAVESIPLMSPLWTPSPETKMRLKDLLPDVKHVKARSHQLYPRLAAGPPKSA